jgi:hypothetical protein
MSEFSDEIRREAKLRRMEPADYVQELEECRLADARLDEIDRKKLKEMQPVEEEEEEVLL